MLSTLKVSNIVFISCRTLLSTSFATLRRSFNKARILQSLCNTLDTPYLHQPKEDWQSGNQTTSILVEVRVCYRLFQFLLNKKHQSVCYQTLLICHPTSLSHGCVCGWRAPPIRRRFVINAQILNHPVYGDSPAHGVTLLSEGTKAASSTDEACRLKACRRKMMKNPLNASVVIGC